MRNRLLALMGEKQAKDEKAITPVIVAKEVGLSRQAIHKWIHNDVKSFTAETLDALCQYFDCEVGDLLYRTKDDVQN